MVTSPCAGSGRSTSWNSHVSGPPHRVARHCLVDRWLAMLAVNSGQLCARLRRLDLVGGPSAVPRPARPRGSEAQHLRRRAVVELDEIVARLDEVAERPEPER